MFTMAKWKAALFEWRNRRLSGPGAGQLASQPLVTDMNLRKDQAERLGAVFPDGVDQFDAMLVHVGVDTKAAPLSAAVRADLYLSCTECQERSECTHWLAGDRKDDAYKEFCQNAPIFDLIAREGWQGEPPDSAAPAGAAPAPQVSTELHLRDILGSRRAVSGD